MRIALTKHASTCLAWATDEVKIGTAEGGETCARPAKETKHSSPSSTLESSFEALNVKKFDLTFAMDPLFRRTSAQFDEGGARGMPHHTHCLGPVNFS